MLDSAEILNASILIVNDQPADVMLLECMLRDAGYRNCSATMDPRSVCSLYLRHRYDLILLDLQMPEMVGFEVMEALAGIETCGYLPVLVTTAEPGHQLRALQAGARDFISKPFELMEVQTRIRNLLEVHLLYRQLDLHNLLLEQKVLERTAALRDSEARFKSLAELSSDWYWEQDAMGQFTRTSGPVFEMLGMDSPVDVSVDQPGPRWNSDGRAQLDANIAARRPFLDHVYSRTLTDGSVQYLQVSGEPMFDAGSAFIGYRGVGTDISDRVKLHAFVTPTV